MFVATGAVNRGPIVVPKLGDGEPQSNDSRR